MKSTFAAAAKVLVSIPQSDGSNLRADVTHLWKTHPVAHGSRRFQWSYRVCRLVSVEGDTATIRLTGLKSRPIRQVPAAELVEVQDADQIRLMPLSA